MRGFKNFKGSDARCPSIHFLFYVHGVCHLDFGGSNPHVKYLCAVAIFYDEYYSVIGPFWIF